MNWVQSVWKRSWVWGIPSVQGGRELTSKVCMCMGVCGLWRGLVVQGVEGWGVVELLWKSQ